jgi:hypothetical protein
MSHLTIRLFVSYAKYKEKCVHCIYKFSRIFYFAQLSNALHLHEICMATVCTMNHVTSRRDPYLSGSNSVMNLWIIEREEGIEGGNLGFERETEQRIGDSDTKHRRGSVLSCSMSQPCPHRSLSTLGLLPASAGHHHTLKVPRSTSGHNPASTRQCPPLEIRHALVPVVHSLLLHQEEEVLMQTPGLDPHLPP